jgi:hypothetical protein
VHSFEELELHLQRRQEARELAYVDTVMARVKAVCTAVSMTGGKRRMLRKLLVMAPILLPSAFVHRALCHEGLADSQDVVLLAAYHLTAALQRLDR